MSINKKSMSEKLAKLDEAANLLFTEYYIEFLEKENKR